MWKKIDTCITDDWIVVEECDVHTGTNVDEVDGVQDGYVVGDRNDDGFIFQIGGLTGMWKLKK